MSLSLRNAEHLAVVAHYSSAIWRGLRRACKCTVKPDRKLLFSAFGNPRHAVQYMTPNVRHIPISGSAVVLKWPYFIRSSGCILDMSA